MSRSIEELIENYKSDPTQWEFIRSESTPSTKRGNCGGASVQELFRHKVTGEEMVRHTLLRPNGKPLGRSHFRTDWK